QVALVHLDPELVVLGRLAHGRQPALVGVDGADVGALAGHGHRGVPAAGAQDEDPFALGLADQAEVGFGGDVGPVGHVVVGQVGLRGVGGGVRALLGRAGGPVGGLAGHVGRRVAAW